MMGDNMNRKVIGWLKVLAWCGLIFCFTASPLFTGENTANWIREILDKFHLGHSAHIEGGFFSFNFIIRKATHLTAFGILAILFYQALRPWRYAKPFAWLFTVIYAASDEWHQSFQPGRTPKVTDVFIDASGALIALFIILPVITRILNRETRSGSL